MSRIDRRSFLRRLAAATAAAVATAAADLDPSQVDVERILWTPGEKTLFLPPDGGWKPPIAIVKEIPAEYSAVRRQLYDSVTMPDGKTHAVARVHGTKMGTAYFDAHGNLLKLGQHVVVSAVEHATYEGQLYDYQQRDVMGGREQRMLRHMQRRLATGVYDGPSALAKAGSLGVDFNWRG